MLPHVPKICSAAVSGGCNKAVRQESYRRAECRAAILAEEAQQPEKNKQSIWKPNQVILSGKDVEESAMWKQIKAHQLEIDGKHSDIQVNLPASILEQSYQRCAEVTSHYAKTFYLGTALMTKEKAQAIWAIYVWCRRTDELVDGPNASKVTPAVLDRWEQRLEGIFEGRPYDEFDAALTETCARFPLHIQPFKDMIEGMRMDMRKHRYQTYDELYEYCYRVAGTVALMSNPVMGVSPEYKGPLEQVYRAALALGTANQLTNILRDVGEDAKQRNRIYVPIEELEQFKITEKEVIQGLHRDSDGNMDKRWSDFMQFQIKRARDAFNEAEAGVNMLDKDARWPVWTALILYRQILEYIESNGYDNFNKRAYVPKWRKFMYLPVGLVRAQFPSKFDL